MRVLALLIGLLILPGPGQAQAQAQAQAQESLVVEPPMGWQLVFDQAQAGSRYREWKPRNGAISDNGESITVQEVGKTDTGIETFAGQLIDKQNAFCAEPLIAGPERYTIKDRRVVAFVVQCNRPTGVPEGIAAPLEYLMMKVIEGDDQFFVATRSWQGMAINGGHPRFSEQAETDWTRFFESVEVCGGPADLACEN
ncbi:MAG: hypothetical protein ACPGOV_04355 [Magnetovibrionaceae bacterium]